MIYQGNKLPPRIYVAGRYSGTDVISVLKNIGAGEAMCAELFMKGFAPFSPWADAVYVKLYYGCKHDKNAFYAASLAWLEVSDAMLVISGRGDGRGVDAEIKFAEERGIPVFYSIYDLEEWRNDFLKGER
jgi:hypothetical protein